MKKKEFKNGHQTKMCTLNWDMIGQVGKMRQKTNQIFILYTKIHA